MIISTQDCKNYIASIAYVIGSDLADNWKRTKKYNQDGLILRDFTNQDGRMLTISENNSTLSLYQLIPLSPNFKYENMTTEQLMEELGKEVKDMDMIIPYSKFGDQENCDIEDSPLRRVVNDNQANSLTGVKYIGRDVTEGNVFDFIAQCIVADPEIVNDYDGSIVDAVKPESWTVWQKWGKSVTIDKSYNKHPLKDFFDTYEGWGFDELYYQDENENTIIVNPNDILQIFCIGMDKYDTRYRIFVFEDIQHNLLLGCNNPD